MKKLFSLAVVLMLCMALAVTAFATTADLDLSKTDLADGAKISATETSVALPAEIEGGKSLDVHLKGTSGANFRVRLMPAGDFNAQICEWVLVEVDEDGNFDTTITLTVFDDGTASAVHLKGPDYMTPLTDLSVESLSVTGDFEIPVVAPEDNTPADNTPAEDNTPADAAPAETGIVLAVLPMAVAAAAIAVSKKR